MKRSDLDPRALDVAAEKTFHYEWPRAGVGEWRTLPEETRETYRKEIAATICAYLDALSTLTTSVSSAALPSSQGRTDSESVETGVGRSRPHD